MTTNNNIIISGDNFPSARIMLSKGDSAFIQSGSMIYKNNVQLQTRLNANGSGLTKFIKAVGRSITSGENVFITEVVSLANDGFVTIAPEVPGQIIVLDLDETHQYRLKDKAFLALLGDATYVMKSQNIGQALFGGTGGLFVMETMGCGQILINSFGSIEKVHLENEVLTVDNENVVAWDTNLHYDIHMENNWYQSIGTGEGLVNTFSGTGDIYIQTLNIKALAQALIPYLPPSSNN